MPHQIGFVEKTDANPVSAHYQMLEVVKNFCQENGWDVLRYDTSKEDRELILKAPGLTGMEEIFVGLRTYQNSFADYYNLAAAGFAGYLPKNSFNGQPQAQLSGVPAHHLRIDYWLTMNAQRLVLVMKLGTPVYESLYLGKMLPYARPSQFPYPLVVGGMLNGLEAKRFSETEHRTWVKGVRQIQSGYYPVYSKNLTLRFNDGAWKSPDAWPYCNETLCGVTYSERDTEGFFPINPVILSDAVSGIFGELDGVYHVTGFNNLVENTFTLKGENHVVFQDVWRTGHNDYFAVRMDD